MTKAPKIAKAQGRSLRGRVGLRAFQDLSGRSFGRWSVIAQADHKGSRVAWECACACGTRRDVLACHLTSGASVSCGCFKAELKVRMTHGMTDTPEHKSWMQMKARCTNKNSPDYEYYGGRGISVCARWLNSFEAFYADMGARPTPRHSIDREDVNGDYEPANCRWATKTQQSRNTRRARYITIEGVTMTLADAAEKLGMNYSTVKWRLRKGQTFEQALGISE